MKDILTKRKFTRLTAILLAVAVIFGTMFALPVSAASGDKVTITFDYCYDSTGNIIKFQQTMVSDGYTVGTPGEELCKIFADGKEAYCIEPGHTLYSGNTLTEDGSTLWKNLGSAKQKAINLVLLYGKPGSGKSLSGTEDQKWVATQLIVWEFVSGCRSTANGYKCTNTKFIDGICADGANPGVKSVYNAISKSLANYSTVPSFASAIASKAETYEMKYTPQKGTITVEKTGEIFSNVTAVGGGYTDENGNDVALPTIYQPEYSVSGLAGAVFEIYADEDITTPDGTVRAKKDELVATLKTNTKGTATSKQLYLGKYRVVEKTAPNGFVLNRTVNHIALTYAGQNEKVTNTSTSFTNDRQKVEIDLTKVLEQNEKFNIGSNDEILNVSFGLYADEDLKAANGSVIPKDGLLEIITCDEKGKATFTTDLPIGSYYVKEISTDNHYILSDKKYPVVFEYAGQDTATVHTSVNDGEPIENEIIYGTIKGLKIDRETGENIAGALFGMFKAEKKELSEKTAILTAESNEEGIFTFENVPYGEYIVSELKPAEGYLPNEENYQATVSEDEEVIEITVENDKIPELGTTATIDGKKEFTVNGDITIDDVVSYKHLTAGKEYTIKGVLMDKSTGKQFLVDGKEVCSEVTFTPETADGEVTVSFTFDGSIITKDTEIVAFETLYRDETEIAVHADIDDKDQTVTVHPQPEPEKPQTGDNSNLGFYIGLGSVAVGGLIAFLIIKFKRKDEDDE